MGACLSRFTGGGGGCDDSNFRHLNDSRHVMLLLAKKERERERCKRVGRSFSLDLRPSCAGTDTETHAGPSWAATAEGTTTTATTTSSSSSSHHPSITTSVNTATSISSNNSNSQRSLIAGALQRGNSCNSSGNTTCRSKRSLMQLASVTGSKTPSARRNFIESQKELTKLNSYGEDVDPPAQSSTTATMETAVEKEKTSPRQAKAA